MATAVPVSASGRTYAHPQQTTTGDRRTAPDGITRGWLVFYPYPTDEPSQQWRKIPATLVIARHSRVVRRIKVTSIWGWAFWDNGRQVAYKAGPLHGETECVLEEVKSGHVLASFQGDCRNNPDDAPAWVKSLE